MTVKELVAMHRPVIAAVAVVAFIPVAATAHRAPGKAAAVEPHRASVDMSTARDHHPAEDPIVAGAKLEAAYWDARASIPRPAGGHRAPPAVNEH